MIKKSTYILKNEDILQENRIIKGYASVYNVYDGSKDRTMKGCFARSIRDWGPEGKNKIKFYYNHKQCPIGIIKGLEEDEHGLRITAEFGSYGEDIYQRVLHGSLNEFSWSGYPLEYMENDKGGMDYKNIKLYEVSIVDYADNEMSMVTSKFNNKIYLQEKLDILWRDASKIKNKNIQHEIQGSILRIFNYTPPSGMKQVELGDTLKSEQNDSKIIKTKQEIKAVEPVVDIDSILERQLQRLESF